jgi:hypothetical protein
MLALAVIDSMKWTFFIVLVSLTLTSFDGKTIVVDEAGFNDIRIGTTTLSEIRRRHMFSKRIKTWRHALYRTDNGRVGVMYCYEQIKTRHGITYFFSYESGTKDPITLKEILFTSPASVVTSKGIELGKSTFQDVEAIYGEAPTSFDHGKLVKEYVAIEFYSARLIGSDSIDRGYIVTGLKIKRVW